MEECGVEEAWGRGGMGVVIETPGEEQRRGSASGGKIKKVKKKMRWPGKERRGWGEVS